MRGRGPVAAVTRVSGAAEEAAARSCRRRCCRRRRRGTRTCRLRGGRGGVASGPAARPDSGDRAASRRRAGRIAVPASSPSISSAPALSVSSEPPHSPTAEAFVKLARMPTGIAPELAATGVVTPPRRVFLETYGCQMNVADTELLTTILRKDGYEPTPDPARADVLLLNTCAIRERAQERVLGRLTELLQYKAARPSVQLGLLGCLATHQRESLLDRAPYLDLIVGPDGYRELPRLLRGGADPHVEVRLDRDETYSDVAPEHGPGPRAWISVMRGCDKFCTFCVVPYTRGRERSLPPDAVLAQVEAAVALGKREVVFLGQTVNAYRVDGVDFAELLRRTARVAGLERIRFTSPHPSDVTPAMIDVMATEPKVMPYLHLPLQSASDRVLAAMERSYTVEEYRELLATLRERIPSL